MMQCRLLLALSLFAAVALGAAGAEPAFPAPTTLGPVDTYGRNIQRTMTLLATSTPEKRNTVCVLFYGQSITEQHWSKLVAEDLRRRFPHANLIIENRAIGGFASQLLVKTAETDLYAFAPDLVIFHVYGSHIEYDGVLMQTDHITRDEELTEESDGSKLSPKTWSPWVNHAFLPATAKKYGCELANQRELWKQYLRDHKLPAAKLLKDGVHLNDHGCFLMAEIVKAYLRHDPKFTDAPWKDLVRTYAVGKDVQWADGKLALDFDGNRVDVIAKEGKPTAAVTIDGKKPSEFPELYTLTRTTAHPRSIWPCLLRVGAEKPLQVEDWTLTLTEVSPDMKQFRFTLAGSKTGPDGEGGAGQRFVSNSGRVVIDPADWNFEYALKVFKTPLPANFKIQWKVLPLFQDEFRAPAVKDQAIESTVTLAQGLPNGKHRLELRGGPDVPITAVRVYRPAMSAGKQ